MHKISWLSSDWHLVMKSLIKRMTYLLSPPDSGCFFAGSKLLWSWLSSLEDCDSTLLMCFKDLKWAERFWLYFVSKLQSSHLYAAVLILWLTSLSSMPAKQKKTKVLGSFMLDESPIPSILYLITYT